MNAQLEYALFFLGLLLVPITLAIFGMAAFQRNRRMAIIGMVCLAISVFAFARVRYAQFWEIDACLDHGGSYNYEIEQCEYE